MAPARAPNSHTQILYPGLKQRTFQVGTYRLNLEHFNAARGERTLTAFADDIGIDKGTMSRVASGQHLPGNKFMAHVVSHTDKPHDYFFELSD
jgi:hypothetical protein